MVILVTGSTGHVGGALVRQLADSGHPVRAMTRRPSELTGPDCVEVVYGDCEQPASLDQAFRGIDRAFLMSAQATGSAEYPTHDLALVAAARRAGVRHLVKLSVYDGGNQEDALGTWHRAAESAITSSGATWTLLRPGRFMSNALQWSAMIRGGDDVHLAFPDRPAAPIDPADVAAVAAAALTTGDHRNVAYQLSGPQVLTPVDELRILADVLGRALRPVPVPVGTVRAALVRSGMTARVADAIVARVVGGDDGSDVLPAVQQILGRPPRTFTQWAREHAARFTDHGTR